MTRLLLLIGSGVSWRTTVGDEAEGARDCTCGVGAEEGTAVGAFENKGMVAEE